MLDRLFGAALDDGDIFGEKVIPGHPRFSGKTGGNDDDVRAGGIGVVIASFHGPGKVFNRAGLPQVKGLALRYPFDDIEQHDIAQATHYSPMGRGRTDITRTDDGNFLSHCSILVYKVCLWHNSAAVPGWTGQNLLKRFQFDPDTIFIMLRYTFIHKHHG